MRSTVIFFLIYHALTFLFLRNRFDPHTKLYGHSSTIIDQIQRQCQFCLLMNIQNILSEIFSRWKCLLCEEWLKGSNISIHHPTLTHFPFLHYLSFIIHSILHSLLFFAKLSLVQWEKKQQTTEIEIKLPILSFSFLFFLIKFNILLNFLNISFQGNNSCSNWVF